MGAKTPIAEDEYLYEASQINSSVKNHSVSRVERLFTFHDFLLLSILSMVAGIIYLTLHSFLGFLDLLPLVIRFYFKFKSVREESLLVIEGLGIQIKRVSYSGQTSSLFVEKSKIRAVIINEAISCADIYPYIAIIIHNQSEMVLAFETIRVKYEVLVNVYNDVMSTLAI